MRIVNPNRKEDELETKALGCNCKCSVAKTIMTSDRLVRGCQ